MNTLSYFVFGDKREYQLELTFSVLSAVRHLRAQPADIRIVLITEQGKTRPDLPIEHVHFSPEEFRAWTNGGTNVHRVKEFSLLKVLETYGGSVAHVDPDTYFTAHPEKVFERISTTRSVMHEDEGPIAADPAWKQMLDTGIREVNGYVVAPETRMFNSGVIGIHYDNRELLREAVDLEDKLYSIAPVFSIEQFATGSVLAKHTRLVGCNDVIEHYWGPRRPFIHLQCARLFPEFSKSVFERLVEQEELPQVGYPKISLFNKIGARLQLGSRARNKDYWFAAISYREALDCAAADPRLANAWAQVAYDCLRHLRDYDLGTWRTFGERMPVDFASFYGGHASRQRWLSGDLQRKWIDLMPS